MIVELIGAEHGDSSGEEDGEFADAGDDEGSSGPLFVASTAADSSSEGSVKAHRHEHNAGRSPNPAMYPAALKIAMRNHIRTLCATSHCVDSLVVYLSSPTRTHDGASLLWDADHNGQVTYSSSYQIYFTIIIIIYHFFYFFIFLFYFF